MSLTLKVKKLHEDAVLPSYSHEGDAAMDIVAIGVDITNKYVEYKTGLYLEVPKGYVCLIFARSGVTNKDLMLKNGVGVLDSGYRGELVLRFKKDGFDIYEKGDRVGQIMLLPYPHVNIEEVKELFETPRGEGGFGSTGK